MNLRTVAGGALCVALLLLGGKDSTRISVEPDIRISEQGLQKVDLTLSTLNTLLIGAGVLFMMLRSKTWTGPSNAAALQQLTKEVASLKKDIRQVELKTNGISYDLSQIRATQDQIQDSVMTQRERIDALKCVQLTSTEKC